MQHPVLGTWILNVEKSAFDANHRPRAGTLTFALNEAGDIVQKAVGLNEKGEEYAEPPQTFFLDGKPHPIPGLPGLTTIASWPDERTLQAEARREDGTLVGKGVFTVSAGGATMTAVTSGWDSQLRPFQMHTVWDRKPEFK
jgi:hypothetical protein